MRIMFIQYAGDYLAAQKLAEETGAETYYGHLHVLETLASVNARFGETAILCCKCPQAYDVRLPSGVRVIGMPEGIQWDGRQVIDTIKAFDPTHMIVFGPLTKFIRLAISQRARLLCLFADSFELNPIRRFVRYGWLSALLGRKEVEWIANHGINACLSLARLGVSRGKIVPWDWPQKRRPHDLPAKEAAPGHPVIFFAGAVIERKGVRDLIMAIAALKKSGITARAEIAGGGEIDKFRAVARAADVEQEVSFLGLIANDEVFRRMRDAAIIAITSQHAYPEGLPLTIYEALSARTPIVASDHPMFRRRLTNEKTALIYEAGNAQALADAVERLLRDADLYQALSRASLEAWESLQVPVKWGELIMRWLDDAPSDRDWIYEHRLDSGLYDARIS